MSNLDIESESKDPKTINVEGGVEGEQIVKRQKDVGDDANVVFEGDFDSQRRINRWKIAGFDDEKGVVIVANDSESNMITPEVPADKFWKSNFEGSDEINQYLWDLRNFHQNKTRYDLRDDEMEERSKFKEASSYVRDVLENFSEGDLEAVRDFIESKIVNNLKMDPTSSIEDVKRRYEKSREKEKKELAETITESENKIPELEKEKVKILEQIERSVRRGINFDETRAFQSDISNIELQLLECRNRIRGSKEKLNSENYGSKEMQKHIRMIENIDKQLNEQNN